jgi:hypothetical protein
MWRAILSIALAANADSLAGLSDWKFIPLERSGSDGIWFPRALNPADFLDTRFEYRWKSERTLASYVCTIEIRPADDIGQNETLPQINIVSMDSLKFSPGNFRMFTAHDVSVGKSAHAIFKQADCRRVAFVYWRK